MVGEDDDAIVIGGDVILGIVLYLHGLRFLLARLLVDPLAQNIELVILQDLRLVVAVVTIKNTKAYLALGLVVLHIVRTPGRLGARVQKHVNTAREHAIFEFGEIPVVVEELVLPVASLKNVGLEGRNKLFICKMPKLFLLIFSNSLLICVCIFYPPLL